LVPVSVAAHATVPVPATSAPSDAPDVPSSVARNVRVECEDDFEVVKHAPQRKKTEFGGIVFYGCVQQVVILPEDREAKDLLQH